MRLRDLIVAFIFLLAMLWVWWEDWGAPWSATSTEWYDKRNVIRD